ncbi:hypothetical protein [Luteirhabdus pelagi]|uniref:hypothetical protein n=1 Tax=Luteirhabdus pelagi TaxID=2792783 RepID=UPI0019396C6C|nr:hypothetical protein [Luteirhabdus pelagi]
MNHLKILFYLILFTTVTVAQESKLSSIDGIVDELLDQITIEKGEKMDTTAIRNLFHPSAILTVANSSSAETVSIDDFLILLKDPYYENGYLEKEISKTIEEYNGIAQVFQSFYGEDSEGLKERGINSYQLTYYQKRWWIVSLLWTIESESEKIPSKYLEK